MNYEEAMKTLKGIYKKTYAKSIIDLTAPLEDEYKKNKYFYEGGNFIIISNEFVDAIYRYDGSPYTEKLDSVLDECTHLFTKREDHDKRMEKINNG